MYVKSSNIYRKKLNMKAFNDVSPKRRAEYESIMDKVDARAMQLAREELGMPEDCLFMGSCHVFWKHKKRILRTEYHMVWRSPQDLNPTVHFD